GDRPRESPVNRRQDLTGLISAEVGLGRPPSRSLGRVLNDLSRPTGSHQGPGAAAVERYVESGVRCGEHPLTTGDRPVDRQAADPPACQWLANQPPVLSRIRRLEDPGTGQRILGVVVLTR